MNIENINNQLEYIGNGDKGNAYYFLDSLASVMCRHREEGKFIGNDLEKINKALKKQFSYLSQSLEADDYEAARREAFYMIAYCTLFYMGEY